MAAEIRSNTRRLCKARPTRVSFCLTSESGTAYAHNQPRPISNCIVVGQNFVMDEIQTGKRVYLVEDSKAMLDRLTEMLEDSGAQVVGTATTAADAIAGILTERPECAVIDFSLAEGTALDVLNGVRTQLPQALLIVITQNFIRQYQIACANAGADYFFDKATDLSKVQDLVRLPLRADSIFQRVGNMQ